MVRRSLIPALVSLTFAAFAEENLWARRERLQKEDLRSVTSWFQKKDPALEWFWVLDKQAVDETYSLMLVDAAPLERRPGEKSNPLFRRGQTGLFVVYGKTNQVYMVLDIFSRDSTGMYPLLRQPGPETAYLHFHSDYGFYHGTYKYLYNLAQRKPARKLVYGRLAATASARGENRVFFAASFPGEAWHEGGPPRHNAIIALEGTPEGSLPKYQMVELPGAPVKRLELRGNALVLQREGGDSALDPADLKRSVPVPPEPERRPLPLPVWHALAAVPGWRQDLEQPLFTGREWLLVWNGEAGRQTTEPSGIYVVSNSGKMEFFPVPAADLGLYERLREKRSLVAQRPMPSAEGLDTEIGPFALDGDTLWFANTFYDGEGMSGVGAIGSFDLVSRKFEMRYLPEIAPWSASAIKLEGDDLWIGLMRRPEGCPYGAGLLRYNQRTAAVRTYPVSDLIHSIESLGGTLYAGTSDGVYMLRGEQLTHLRFEPDASGRFVMVARK